MMELENFRHLLDAHGPDLEMWAETDRQQAELLLDQSAEAHAALVEGRRLDRLLSVTLTGERASDGLRKRILAVPAETPPDAPTWLAVLVVHPWRYGALVAAAALSVGIWTGSMVEPLNEPGPQLPALVAEIDLGDLAFGPDLGQEISP